MRETKDIEKSCQEKQQTDRISVAISNKILKNKDESKYEVKDFTFYRNITIQSLANKIKEGRSIAFDFTDGNRFYADEKHFRGSDFICIDIDNDKPDKITLDDIQNSNDERPKYIRENASLIYTSHSHRKNGNSDRYKVLFHLPHTVREWDSLGDILNGLKRKFPESDQGNYVTGRYHSGGENTEVMILGNRLTEQALDELLSLNISDPKTSKTNGTRITPEYAEAVYRGELNEFPQEARKDKHNRNNKLFATSRRIGEILCYLEHSYSEVFQELVRVAESIGTDKSYTLEQIRKTVEGGLNKGKNKPLQSNTGIDYADYSYNTDSTNDGIFHKPWRQFATRDYKNAIQFPKNNMNTLKTETLEIQEIDDEKKVDHIKTIYAIKGETNDENVQVFYILKSLENWDLHKYYMGYWVYANEVKAKYNRFYDLRLNDVLECMYNGNFKEINPKYERYKMFDVTNALAYIQTRIVENNTMRVVKKYLDYEARVRDNGKIDKTSLKMLELFNRDQNDYPMGSYSKKSIFRLSGNDFGLAFYLTENINRKELSRKRRKTDGYLPPVLSRTPLKWDTKYACKCAGLYKTYSTNPSKAISDLEGKFENLKEYEIVDKWNFSKDEGKYEIYVCNPFK